MGRLQQSPIEFEQFGGKQKTVLLDKFRTANEDSFTTQNVGISLANSSIAQLDRTGQ